MSDDTVTVTIGAGALKAAHDLARLAGYDGLTDREAVEAAIAAHVQELRATFAGLDLPRH